jgi:hypothetical protein
LKINKTTYHLDLPSEANLNIPWQLQLSCKELFGWVKTVMFWRPKANYMTTSPCQMLCTGNRKLHFLAKKVNPGSNMEVCKELTHLPSYLRDNLPAIKRCSLLLALTTNRCWIHFCIAKQLINTLCLSVCVWIHNATVHSFDQGIEWNHLW